MPRPFTLHLITRTPQWRRRYPYLIIKNLESEAKENVDSHMAGRLIPGPDSRSPLLESPPHCPLTPRRWHRLPLNLKMNWWKLQCPRVIRAIQHWLRGAHLYVIPASCGFGRIISFPRMSKYQVYDMLCLFQRTSTFPLCFFISPSVRRNENRYSLPGRASLFPPEPIKLNWQPEDD